MKKSVWITGLAVMMLGLTACGAKEEAKPAGATPPAASSTTNAGGGGSGTNTTAPAAAADPAAPRKLTYGGKEYTVPTKTDKIVITGAVESLEDALVLGVKPIGSLTVGGKYPPLFAKVTEGVPGIGEKTQPNLETILKLKPDVILASTKFPAETLEKLGKVGTTIPVSHISTDWEANLNLLAELSGKQAEAKKALQTYKDDVKAAKEKLAPVFKDKKVIAVRIRTGNIFIYPQDVFFNPSIYAELGASVPEEVKQAKAQQQLSLEKLSELNPDYVFVQFAEEENSDTPKALEDLQKNPIWKSINAVKNENVFVNLVDPVAQGGTAYSKIAFLDAVKKSKLFK
ncbi:ABC transporter substrate-binding protein [Paenibacillus hodogayensis]|uniref:ABC transporter substrate-binding protein n=1 Tax=Paenibacillus hodogayensis TaxID=279208 RepID=A0ABV5VZ02_9BACL